MPDHSQLPAFEEIYESYAGRILNLAYRMTANEEDARDLTQDIFMKVYQSLDTFEKRSHIYTWIYRIAINHILNYLQKQKRIQWFDLMDKKVSVLLREESAGLNTTYPTSRHSSDRNMEAKERAAMVWAAVQSLSPKYRIPLVLHHYEEMSYKEIAEMLDLSMSAVESRIHRAKKKLINILEPMIKQL